MIRESIVDILGWAAILCWLGVSTFFAWSGDGDMFQRVGSIGIAAGVGYFASVKWPSSAPIGYHESKTLTQAQVISLAKEIAHANDKMRTIAIAIAEMQEFDGRQAREEIKALAAVPANDLRKYDARLQDQEAKLEVLLTGSKDADSTADAVSRSGVRLQAVVVILGTLQSGFGSLVFNTTCHGAIQC